MKIRFEFVVEVDPDKWRNATGIGTDESVREDVRSYVVHNLHQSFRLLTEDAEGAITVK